VELLAAHLRTHPTAHASVVVLNHAFLHKILRLHDWHIINVQNAAAGLPRQRDPPPSSQQDARRILHAALCAQLPAHAAQPCLVHATRVVALAWCQGPHWVAIDIDCRSGNINVLDSCPGCLDLAHTKERLLAFLAWYATTVQPPELRAQLPRWSFCTEPDVPNPLPVQPAGSNDCAMFALLAQRAVALRGSLPAQFPLQPSDGIRARALLYTELCRNRLQWLPPG
jgi:hypothetical protein